MRTTPEKTLGNARAGTAAVEFALVLPLLLLLLFGTVAIGALLADYHLVTKSLRAAARYLAQADAGPGGLALDCAAGTVDATSLPVQNALRLAMTGRIDGDVASEPLLAGWTAASPTPEATGIAVAAECRANDGSAEQPLEGLYTGRDRVAAIVLTAEVPVPLAGSLPGLPGSVTLRVTHRQAQVAP